MNTIDNVYVLDPTFRMNALQYIGVKHIFEFIFLCFIFSRLTGRTGDLLKYICYSCGLGWVDRERERGRHPFCLFFFIESTLAIACFIVAHQRFACLFNPINVLLFIYISYRRNDQ